MRVLGSPSAGGSPLGGRVAMKLSDAECWARLAAASHGSLATRHPRRGVDSVPVVFVLSPSATVLLPIDQVKAKRSPRLQRLVNLEADDRSVLLVDHYDDDWSRLWWVRVHGRARARPPWADARTLLAARFAQYQDPSSVVAVIELVASEITGWAAGADGSGAAGAGGPVGRRPP